jgi:hypothetical protein
MGRSTLFTLERERTRHVRRHPHGRRFDDGQAIELRYDPNAFPALGTSVATGTTWTAALEDGFADDPDVVGVPATPNAMTAESPVDVVPPAPPPAEEVAGPDVSPAANAAPEEPETDPVPVSAPAPAAEPAVNDAPSVTGEDRAMEPATQHDDRFMTAIADAARGRTSGPEDGPAPEEEPAATPAAMSHSIFDQLGNQLAHAATYDAGAFTARRVFDRLDDDLVSSASAATPRGNAEGLGQVDVVQDLASILRVAPDDLRAKLDGPSEPDPSDEPVRMDDEPEPAPHVTAASRPPAITRLQSYLGVSDAGFATHEARYFAALKDHLVRAGTVAATDALDRSNFADAVEDFQRAEGLEADGVPGEDTLWALQRNWGAVRNLGIQRVDADRWVPPPLTFADHDPDQHGYDRFRFRDDAASRYDDLRREVTAAGGIITSSGSMRDLGATVTANRSPKSFHYSGLAFDLATPTGMRDPDVDPYIVTKEGDRWRVWARADQGQSRKLDAVVWASGTTSTRPVTATVIDFTELAAGHGFHRIPPRSGFPGDIMAAEWWHFQANELLVPWISQFGVELLSLAQYDESRLQAATDVWRHRKAIFQRLPARHGWH